MVISGRDGTMHTGTGGDPLGACVALYSDHLYTIPLLFSPTVPSHFLFSSFWFNFNFLVWINKIDLLFDEYGSHYPRVADSGPPEPRQNGTAHPSNILAATRAVFLVIIVSPRRNIGTHPITSRENSPVFSFPRIQLRNGGLL